MRKILLLIVLTTLFFPYVANAQLNIISIVPKAETICDSNDIRGHSILKSTEDDYYIYINSTNEFDDVEYMYIGKTKESALLTLEDIRNLFANIPIGDMVIISDHHNQRIVLYKSFNKQFQLQFNMQAGTRCLSLKNIEDFINALSAPIEENKNENSSYDWMDDPNYH